MLSYRYVLHLLDGESEQIVRHVSHRPLEVGAIVEMAGYGEWQVVEVIASANDHFKDAVAYAEPASGSTAADEAVEA